jgi:uncharacterized protein YicC (UPF0701 family)
MGKYTEQIKAFEAVEPEVTSQTAPKSKYADEIAKAEGLNPQGIEQVKNAAIEGTGGPSIQRTMSGVEMGPLGISFNPIKYKAANPNTDTWDMVGDILTSATTVIPGGTMAKTAVKTGIQTVAGAGTGALLTALGGTEKLAAAAQKYPILKPILLAVQAGGFATGLKEPKITPLSKTGQEAANMGVPFSQSAEAKIQGGSQKLIDREYEIKQKYPDIYEKYIQGPRQTALKRNLEGIGGEASTMTGESVGATIKSNVEAKRKTIGEEFGQAEEKITNIKQDFGSYLQNKLKKETQDFNENNIKDGFVLNTGEAKTIPYESNHPDFIKNILNQYNTETGSNLKLGALGGVDIGLKNTGAIRYKLNGQTINFEIMHKPTAQQIKSMEDIYLKYPQKNKQIRIDFTGKDGMSRGNYSTDINLLTDDVSNLKNLNRVINENFKRIKEFMPKIKTIDVSSKLDNFLKSQGVGETWTGNEKIKSIDTANTIKERAKFLENAKSTEDLLSQKRQFGEDIKKVFKEKGTKDNNALKATYRIIDDAIYESIPDKKIADEWKSVNEKWSDLSDKLEKVEGTSEAGRIANTEASKIFANKVLSKGPEAIDALKDLAGEKSVKDAGMQYLFYEGTKEGRVNIDKIASKLAELKNKGMAQKIFGSDLEKLDNFVNVGKFVEAPMSPRPGINKYGGSQTAIVTEIAKNLDPNSAVRITKFILDFGDKRSAEAFLKNKDPRLKTSTAPGLIGSTLSGGSRGLLLEKKNDKFKSLSERKAKK